MSTTTLEPQVVTIPEVERGALWLDEHVLGWADKIDIGTLELRSCELCVAGQILSSGPHGIAGWGLAMGLDENEIEILSIYPSGMGMDLPDDVLDGTHRNDLERDAAIDAHWLKLQLAWEHEIRMRRST